MKSKKPINGGANTSERQALFIANFEIHTQKGEITPKNQQKTQIRHNFLYPILRSYLAEVEGVEPPRRYERPLSFQD